MGAIKHLSQKGLGMPSLLHLLQQLLYLYIQIFVNMSCRAGFSKITNKNSQLCNHNHSYLRYLPSSTYQQMQTDIFGKTPKMFQFCYFGEEIPCVRLRFRLIITSGMALKYVSAPETTNNELYPSSNQKLLAIYTHKMAHKLCPPVLLPLTSQLSSQLISKVVSSLFKTSWQGNPQSSTTFSVLMTF